ncbi:MAG TPA: hypothetical protein VFJ48_10975 [Casimicrobiaceae bacterium]|nr:hypothetical protein [Casimicrobiaceae bacterium]
MKTPVFRSWILRDFPRILIALSFACFTAAAGAQGNYLGTFFSDLWATKGEAGSGVTATHQEPTIFLTLFIYRSGRAPYWLTATVARTTGTADTYVYTGDLYETSGPPFGGPFDPTTVTYRKVGTAQWSSSDGINVTLTYSIDGVAITKTLNRFSLSNLDFSGSYTGAITYQTGNCSSPALNGRTVVDYGLTTVTQSTNSVAIVLHGTNATCTFSGNYLQLGSWGNAGGTLTCTDGSTGQLLIAAMQRTVAGFTAVFDVMSPQCELFGTISGITIPTF